MRLYAETIPAVGILTTKSISKKPMKGNPTPVLEQVTEWEFRNAVGLANPGVDAMINELKEWKVPADKFLLASIFGENTEEFVYVAKKLSPYVDGLELNISCPHADKGGAIIGSNPDLAEEVVKSVCDAVKVPVITKLTPNVDNIADIAEVVLKAGSDGLSLINTWGPHKSEVLSKGKGGVSGRRIYSILRKSLEKITPVVNKYEECRKDSVPVIAMGGIYCSADLAELKEIGPKHLFFGIGTALFDKNHHEQKKFLEDLHGKQDMNWMFDRRDYSVDKAKAKKRLMKYRDYKIEDIIIHSDDLRVFYFKDNLLAEPGQFAMAWIPGVSENPFTIASSIPLSIAVKKYSDNKEKTFTEALWEYKRGSKLLVRGPYGNSFPMSGYGIDTHVLVAGGAGAATLLPLARDLSSKGNVVVLLGAKTEEELLFTESQKNRPDFSDYGALKTITDDKGFVTVLLENFLSENKSTFNVYTCGPEIMMKKTLEIASKDPNFNQGYAAVERYMKCGMGGCGSCVMDGKSTCKDGPVRSWDILKDSQDFGRYKRDEYGIRKKI